MRQSARLLTLAGLLAVSSACNTQEKPRDDLDRVRASLQNLTLDERIVKPNDGFEYGYRRIPDNTYPSVTVNLVFARMEDYWREHNKAPNADELLRPAEIFSGSTEHGFYDLSVTLGALERAREYAVSHGIQLPQERISAIISIAYNNQLRHLIEGAENVLAGNVRVLDISSGELKTPSREEIISSAAWRVVRARSLVSSYGQPNGGYLSRLSTLEGQLARINLGEQRQR